MKFKIRFAEQIVGIFIILALVSLVVVIALLGRSQRWFAKDISFTTALPSAGGLSKNMPVQYKGFTIGNVKNFYLSGSDDVEVVFTVFEEYRDRMRMGSTVDIMVSPIGLGSQFLIHGGRGELLQEGAFVPIAGSAQARELIRQGLAMEPRHDDSISMIMNRVSSILAQIDEALGEGSDITEIGKILGSLKRTLADAENLPRLVDDMLADLKPGIEEILAELGPLITNVNSIVAEVNDPNSLVSMVLDSEKEVYSGLVSSLGSITSMLDNLDKTIASQLPQIPGLIMELRTTIKTAEDVLVALTNNPLLRKGVPDRVEGQSGGTSPRDLQF